MEIVVRVEQPCGTKLPVRRGGSTLSTGCGLPSYAPSASANARCVCAVPENDVDGLVCNLPTRGEREYKGGSLCRYLLHLKAKGLS